MRQLTDQLRNKDSMLSERERALADKETALGACEVSLAEARQSKREADDQLRSVQRLNDHLEAEKAKLLTEQVRRPAAREMHAPLLEPLLAWNAWTWLRTRGHGLEGVHMA